MITDRQRKSFRIARKLCDVSHRLPNEKDAAFFLRNCVRFERVMRKLPPFQNKLPVLVLAEEIPSVKESGAEARGSTEAIPPEQAIRNQDSRGGQSFQNNKPTNNNATKY